MDVVHDEVHRELENEDGVLCGGVLETEGGLAWYKHNLDPIPDCNGTAKARKY